MGDGKKAARIKWEMAKLEGEAVVAISMMREREAELLRRLGKAEGRAAFRLALLVVVLLCWTVTYFELK